MKLKFCLFFIFLLFLFAAPLLATQSMESDSYQIDWPNMNMGAGLPSSNNYGLGVTTGQTAPGLYEGFGVTGFKVRAGFQYIHSIIPFTFTLDKIAVDFGTLTVGVGTTDLIALEVSCGSAGGYSVTAHENNPLTSTAASTIADTTCDASDTCDESDAGTWTLSTTYGFGYSMSGTDVPSEFSGGKYKQYADLSKPTPETPQTVMTGTNVGRNKQATITLKINVSGLQAAGVYENVITFIATPTY
jgi:hypothetical protein